jgi:hypothetical protein
MLTRESGHDVPFLAYSGPTHTTNSALMLTQGIDSRRAFAELTPRYLIEVLTAVESVCPPSTQQCPMATPLSIIEGGAKCCVSFIQ